MPELVGNIIIVVTRMLVIQKYGTQDVPKLENNFFCWAEPNN